MLAEPRRNDLVALEKLGKKVRVPPGNAIRFARSAGFASAGGRS
jgi:hypothetical protein